MAFQATNGSTREKWVAAFLPSIAIVFVTFMYFTFYANSEMEAVERQFNAAVASSIPPSAVDQLNNQWQHLLAEQTALQSTIDAAEAEVTAKSVAFEQLSPTAKHGAVTALFQKYNVAILQDQAASETSLPTLGNKSTEILRSILSKDAIHFRDLTLTADYPTVVALLKNLPEIPGVLPVSIMLEKTKIVASSDAPEGPSAVWTVTLLM